MGKQAPRARQLALTGAAVQKRRLLSAQADRIELQNKAKSGALVPVAHVRVAWSSAATTVRSALLSVPSRLRSSMPGVTDAVCREVDRLIREALEGLATRRRSASSNGHADDDIPTPEEETEP